MSSGKENLIETDVLVIGGGSAGCFAAIKAKEKGVDVIVVDKGYAGKSGQTPCIMGMFVYDPENHDLNTLKNFNIVHGEYLADRDWADIVLRESTDRWHDLYSWGVEVYKWDREGKLFISPAIKDDGEIYHENFWETPPSLGGFYPFRHMGQFLRKQANKTGVKIMDRITITDLIKQDGRIVGAVGFSADSYDLYVFKAKATILCAGGAGLKAEGIPTSATTGEADAMAYRVGCEITGKEWTENHPKRADFPAWSWTPYDTDISLDPEERAKYMIRPTKGPRSREIKVQHAFNAANQDVGSHWSPTNSQQLEALVAHAGQAPVYWDVAHADGMFHRMHLSPKGQPRKEIDEAAGKLGRVRMVFGRALGQSSHVSDGLWPINKQCAAQVPGLYAAGDCLGARVSGALYTPGYSGAFCAVSGTRAGEGAAEYALQAEKTDIDLDELARLKKVTFAPMERKGGFTPGWVTQVIKNTMFPYWVLYVKHADRLQTTLAQIEFLRDNIVPKLTAKDPHELRLAHEVKSMILNCEMKLRASLFRTESRGDHYREDYPQRDDTNWLAWIKIKEDNGGMKLTKEPIPKKWWPDQSLPYEKRYPTPFPGEVRK